MPSARLLIVEDSRTQADWLAQVLQREGYLVEIAGDGGEAVRKVLANPPDIVLLDMILPDMDGLQVLRVIKSRAEEQFTPVILLSVKSDLDSRVTGLRLGADDFLAKPFAEAEIQARVAAMLRIKTLQDQLRVANAQLERLSVTDGLTGLFNHRFFDERLREEFCRAQRYRDPVSLIMLDLDHFKRVNDEHGHPFGDLVLRETSELLFSRLRDPDICARYGGEEFAVILPKTPLRGAVTVGERFLDLMRKKTFLVEGVESEPHELRITVSIGIAAYPVEGVTSPEQLLKLADEALYRAKHEGRDTLRVHGE
jgi:diguanylate cyclase (GGDEF)-like protein